eukprot:203-Amphidinium_carterae.1
MSVGVPRCCTRLSSSHNRKQGLVSNSLHWHYLVFLIRVKGVQGTCGQKATEGCSSTQMYSNATGK